MERGSSKSPPSEGWLPKRQRRQTGWVFPESTDAPQRLTGATQPPSLSLPKGTVCAEPDMGSAWLAHPEDHDGNSAAGAAAPIELTVRVTGVGAATAALSPDTILP